MSLVSLVLIILLGLTVTAIATAAQIKSDATPKVTAKITLKLSGLKSGAVTLGKSVTAKGTVKPTSLKGGKVTLIAQQQKGAKWLKVKSATRKIGAAGAYSWAYKPAKKGAYRLRAAIAKTSTHAAATTKWLTFKVKPGASGSAVTDNAPTGWRKSAVTVTLSVTGAGVARTQYRLNGSTTWINTNANTFVVAAPANHSNDGIHVYEYQALDSAGHVSAAGACTVRIDTTLPTVNDNAPAGWHKSAVTVTLTIKEAGSGLAKTQYRLSGSGVWLDAAANKFVVDAPANHSNDGTKVYEYQALDNAGNVSAKGTCTVKIDTTAPVVTDNAPTVWSASDVAVTLSPSESGSGLAKTQYRLSGAATPAWIDATSNQFIVAAPTNHSNDGVHIYRYRALDNIGNISATGTCTVRIDTSGPTVTDNASTNWHGSGDVIVTLIASDSGAGSAKTQYRRSGSTTWLDTTNVNQFTVAAPADHSNDGANVYEYRAIDKLGNIGPTGSCTVRIDTIAPTVTDDAPASPSASAVTVTLTANDSASGVAKTQYRLSTSSVWLDTTANQFVVAAPADHSNDGTHAYRYRALDNVGNISATGSCTVIINTL